MGILRSIGKGIATGLDYLSGAFTNPITAIKSPTAAKDKFLETNAKGLSGQITNVVKTVGTTATVAALLVSGGAAAGSTSAKSIGSKAISTTAKTIPKLIPKTLAGKAIAIPATIIGTTALIKNPSGAASTVGKTVEAQIDLGSMIANPTKEGALEFIKEHPVATGAVAGVAALAVGKATTGIVSTLLNTKAIRENTAANLQSKNQEPTPPEYSVIEEKSDYGSGTTVGTNAPAVPVSGQQAPTTPVMPETEVLSTTTAKKRKYHRHKAVIPSIRQNVNVMVSNNSNRYSSKKYINREVLVQ